MPTNILYFVLAFSDGSDRAIPMGLPRCVTASAAKALAIARATQHHSDAERIVTLAIYRLHVEIPYSIYDFHKGTPDGTENLVFLAHKDTSPAATKPWQEHFYGEFERILRDPSAKLSA